MRTSIRLITGLRPFFLIFHSIWHAETGAVDDYPGAVIRKGLIGLELHGSGPMVEDAPKVVENQTFSGLSIRGCIRAWQGFHSFGFGQLNDAMDRLLTTAVLTPDLLKESPEGI